MTDILNKTADFVHGQIEKNLPENLYYHSPAHFEEVVEYAREIGEESALNNDDMEVALIAAYFHDLGFIRDYKTHEDKSIELAAEFLKEQNYPSDKIERVAACIRVTDLEHVPQTLPQKVLADADMLHLGKKKLGRKQKLLKREWEEHLGKKYSKIEWDRVNVKFLEDHRFYTKYAQQRYGKRKQKNLIKLKDRLRKRAEDMADLTSKPGDKINRVGYARLDRGVETVFRTTSRNHINLSAIADNKANMMISVNAIIISIIITVLAGNLHRYNHLLIPAGILIITCLLTIIFAVLSTRPKVTIGMVSSQDIENKRGNLLFFGNFFRMTLDDYEDGMKNLLSDGEYLYGSLIRDIYFLGRVLEKKYRYLRICYDIFVAGLILTVIAFIIAMIVT